MLLSLAAPVRLTESSDTLPTRFRPAKKLPNSSWKVKLNLALNFTVQNTTDPPNSSFCRSAGACLYFPWYGVTVCRNVLESCACTSKLEPKLNRHSLHEWLAFVFTKVLAYTSINAVALLLWCVRNETRVQQNEKRTQLGEPVVPVETVVVITMNICKKFFKSVTAHSIRNHLIALIF